MARLSIFLARVLCLIVLIWPSITLADDQQPSAGEIAWQAAIKVAINGPSDMPLGDQAILHIPPAMAFIPKAEAANLMKAWGNSTGDQFYGLVVPPSNEDFWVMTVDHTAEGYVKDDDAKNWNADELLQSLKDGTEEQNKEREKMGIPALDIVGWIETPNYDASNHRLIWSLKAIDRGAAADAPATVNYNTYALGRDGYFQINLLNRLQRLKKKSPMRVRCWRHSNISRASATRISMNRPTISRNMVLPRSSAGWLPRSLVCWRWQAYSS